MTLLIALATWAFAGPPTSPGDASASDDVAAFEAWSGARLVFDDAGLPPGAWFEIRVPLDDARRDEAARIALEQARRYPKGFLAAAGVKAVGIYAGLATADDDGYHDWSDDLGGYAYFGLFNGTDAVIAADYSPRQLPLTLNHEWFHAVDHADGATADDARFHDAVSGRRPYAAPSVPKDDLQSLRTLTTGDVLDDAVGAYAKKSASEDEAETARWVQAHLADALVQVVDRPDLAGSQRILHVFSEWSAVPLPDGGSADVSWWTDVALGRTALRDRVAQLSCWDALFRPEGRWTVHGYEDDDGVNWTLRAQIAAFGTDAGSIADVAPAVGGQVVAEAEIREIGLLAGYLEHIEGRWTVTAGTRDAFEGARDKMVAAVPDGPLQRALAAASLEELADVLGDRPSPDVVVQELAARGVAVNPYLHAVDDEVVDPDVVAAIRRVQPATARIRVGLGSGSGVVVSPDGVVLTAAHVPDSLGAHAVVKLPDGSVYGGVCTKIDADLDLALIQLDATGLPWAPIAPEAPRVGDPIVVIGQPGSFSPSGHPTGYQPFTVTVGQIRAFADDPLGDQRLGGTSHDAWTYWGHSGSPLFDTKGRIVGLHNSWDPETAMRHAVTWEAIRGFVTS